jgi:hippurate hydrolase
MDGLPLLEETGLSYASKSTGIKDNRNVPTMHACGHDVHMTMWLALAQMMKENSKKWSGTLIFLAQSAEETGQGAKKVVSANQFKSIPKADFNLAVHNHAELEIGTFGFCDNYAMAAVDMMNIKIFGLGGHGAAPEKCIDPIVLSAQFIIEIQTIISRNVSFNDPALITVGSIHGGFAGNVIPDNVELKLTIRTYSDSSRRLILKRIKEIGDHLALAAGLPSDKLPTYDLGDMSIPSVYNSPLLGKMLSSYLRSSYGEQSIAEVKPVMIGEDFGVFGQQSNKIPSYLIWMGTVSKKRKITSLIDPSVTPSLHSSHFAPDIEETLTKNLPMLEDCLLQLFNKK